MAFETSAERSTAQDESDQQVLRFVKRTRTMVTEADGFISGLTTAKTNLEAAKAASDTALSADSENAALGFENTLLAAKLAEATAVLAQANSLKTGIVTLLSA
jgi:hypothetical protein